MSLPLTIIAFYVNPISSVVKGKRKQDLQHFKRAKADRAEGSDLSDSGTEDGGVKNAKRKGRGATAARRRRR